MNKMPIPTYDLKQFIWNKQEGTLTAEASDLCGLGSNMFGRLWDDACDLGLAVKSNKTGATFSFVLEEEHNDREGEVFGWTLKPVKDNCPIKKMTIYND